MLTDGRTTDGRTMDAGVTGILIAHLGAFGSGELKKAEKQYFKEVLTTLIYAGFTLSLVPELPPHFMNDDIRF